MHKNKIHWLVLCIALIALVLGSWMRFVHVYNIGYVFDTITTQHTWAKAVSDMGIVSMWRQYNLYLDYPILNLWFIGTIEWLNRMVLGGGPQSFVFLLKVVYWIGDIALLALLWFINHKYFRYSTNAIILLSSLVYVYPGLWFVSGVWGQSDTLLGVVAIASVVLFIQNKWYYHILGGIILGIGFYFKMQVTLVIAAISILFIVKYYTLFWLHWKRYLLIIVTLVGTMACAAKKIEFSYKSDSGLYTGASSYEAYMNFPNQLAAACIVVGLIGIIVLLSVQLRKAKNNLTQLYFYIWGFIVAITVVTAVSIGINPLQWYRSMIEPLQNGAFYYSASANINNIMTYYADTHNWVHHRWIQMAVVFSVLGYFGFHWVKYYTQVWLNKKNIFEAIGYFILIYYTFATGRVHSRYGHFAILFLLFAFWIRKKTWVEYIAFAGILFFYSCNQISVYTSISENSLSWPAWLKDVFFVSNYYVVAIGMALSAAILLYYNFNKKLHLSKGKEVNSVSVV